MTFYYTSHREELSSDATMSLFIHNGPNSPFVATINLIEVSGEGPANVDIYKNVTEDSAGTSVPMRRNVTNPSGYLGASYGGSYSGRSDPPLIEELTTGSSVGKIGGRVSLNGGEVVTLLEPEDNLLVDVTNTSNSTNNYNILMRLREYDEYSPRVL